MQLLIHKWFQSVPVLTSGSFRRPGSWTTRVLARLLYAAVIVTSFAPVAPADESKMLDQIKESLDRAIENSGYKGKMKMGVGEAPGLDLKIPCKAHRIAIERLKGAAFDWKGNEMLSGFGKELAKALANIPGVAKLPAEGVRRLIELLLDEAAEKLLENLKSKYTVRQERLIFYEDSREGGTLFDKTIPCKNGRETFMIYLDLKTGRLHVEIEAFNCCPEKATVQDVKQYWAQMVADVLVGRDGTWTLEKPRLAPLPFGACCDDMSSVDDYLAVFSQHLGVPASAIGPGGKIEAGGGKEDASGSGGTDEESDGEEFGQLPCPTLEELIKETHRNLVRIKAEIEAMEKAGAKDLTDEKATRDRMADRMAAMLDEWTKRCLPLGKPDDEMIRIMTIYLVPPSLPEDKSKSMSGEHEGDNGVTLPGGSNKFYSDDVFLVPGTTLDGDRFTLEPLELRPRPAGGSVSIVPETTVGPTVAMRTPTTVPFADGNSVTLVGYSNSPDYMQDVIDFSPWETLYLRVEHINLDPELDRVEITLEQNGKIVTNQAVQVQPDGSFTGEFKLSSLVPGDVNVIVSGLARMPDGSVREVLQHRSSIFVNAAPPESRAQLVPLP